MAGAEVLAWGATKDGAAFLEALCNLVLGVVPNIPAGSYDWLGVRMNQETGLPEIIPRDQASSGGAIPALGDTKQKPVCAYSFCNIQNPNAFARRQRKQLGLPTFLVIGSLARADDTREFGSFLFVRLMMLVASKLEGFDGVSTDTLVVDVFRERLRTSMDQLNAYGQALSPPVRCELKDDCTLVVVKKEEVV
jgi:hypothetical protein